VPVYVYYSCLIDFLINVLLANSYTVLFHQMYTGWAKKLEHFKRLELMYMMTQEVVPYRKMCTSLSRVRLEF